MNKIGFFYDDRGLVEPYCQSKIEPYDKDTRVRIVNYLKAGTLIAIAAGPAYDLMSSTSVLAIPPNIRTDGRWVWTEDVAYYVERYRMMIPTDFLDVMRRNEWRSPVVDNVGEAVAAVFE